MPGSVQDEDMRDASVNGDAPSGPVAQDELSDEKMRLKIVWPALNPGVIHVPGEQKAPAIV